MFDGQHPPTDPAGRPWADGPCKDMAGKPLCLGNWKFVCWGVTGDLEYLSNELSYPHFNSNSPCWFCNVSRLPDSQYPMTDCSVNAAWKGTILP
eukprot:3285114-Alexandrium_andersonii.AAC.1